MAIKYVNSSGSKYKTRFFEYDDKNEKKTIHYLLWGERVERLRAKDGWAEVKAWGGRTGWVKDAHLGDKSLLEIYVIDVGQGDGVLLKTLDGKWHLIDGGTNNVNQMTKRGAANFLRWKFQADWGFDSVKLENVILSHPDEDHFGGLINVLSGDLGDGSKVKVAAKNFYHCGLARFDDAPELGKSEPGEVAAFPQGNKGIKRKGRFITELLDGKADFAQSRQLTDSFADLARLVAALPGDVKRLSAADKYLPGYAPGEGDVVIDVLGPVVERFGTGKEGLRVLGGESIVRNGHSILLRLRYDKARILLTGDLNEKSQQLLLSYKPEGAFAADVAKGCHHGSEDVDLRFIEAMKARATVISSGDNENYAHPQPGILGASAFYGRPARTPGGEKLPPMIYSTELARSVKLDKATRVRVDLSGGKKSVPAKDAEVKPGNAKYRALKRTYISTKLIYGLVNVRTDGKRILCATKEEKGNDFDVKVFQAGVS